MYLVGLYILSSLIKLNSLIFILKCLVINILQFLTHTKIYRVIHVLWTLQEIISLVFKIKKISTNMGPILIGYGDMDFLNT